MYIKLRPLSLPPRNSSSVANDQKRQKLFPGNNNMCQTVSASGQTYRSPGTRRKHQWQAIYHLGTRDWQSRLGMGIFSTSISTIGGKARLAGDFCICWILSAIQLRLLILRLSRALQAKRLGWVHDVMMTLPWECDISIEWQLMLPEDGNVRDLIGVCRPGVHCDPSDPDSGLENSDPSVDRGSFLARRSGTEHPELRCLPKPGVSLRILD